MTSSSAALGGGTGRRGHPAPTTVVGLPWSPRHSVGVSGTPRTRRESRRSHKGFTGHFMGNAVGPWLFLARSLTGRPADGPDTSTDSSGDRGVPLLTVCRTEARQSCLLGRVRLLNRRPSPARGRGAGRYEGRSLTRCGGHREGLAPRAGGLRCAVPCRSCCLINNAVAKAFIPVNSPRYQTVTKEVSNAGTRCCERAETGPAQRWDGPSKPTAPF